MDGIAWSTALSSGSDCNADTLSVSGTIFLKYKPVTSATTITLPDGWKEPHLLIKTPLLAADSLRHIISQVRYFLFLRLSMTSLYNRLLIKPKNQKLLLGNTEWLQRASQDHVLHQYQGFHCKIDKALKRGTELTTVCTLVSLWAV